jgi:pyruvate kinase
VLTFFVRARARVCILGPKVNTVEKLADLRNAGVNIGAKGSPHLSFFFAFLIDGLAGAVRMNFSHGSYEYHQSVIDNTRKMIACKLDHSSLSAYIDRALIGLSSV